MEINIGKFIFKEISPRRYVALVTPSELREAVEAVVMEESYFSSLTAIDFPKEGKIELNYIFWSVKHRAALILKVTVDRNSAVVPTIIDIVPGALGGELEAYDLMGVIFEGNNKLRRGFLASEDVVEKGIYPLRKDSGV